MMMATTNLVTEAWLRATMLFVVATGLRSCFVQATLVRRDEQNLVIPLTYSPDSLLLTASVSVGTPASTYDLIVDTGSPFLVIQKAEFRSTSSTWDAFGNNQPDFGDAGGYITTSPTPEAHSTPLKPKMHFVTDTATLNEQYGERASGGTRGGNVTVGVAVLEGLKDASGLLGLSPPFDKVGKGFGGPGSEQQGKQQEKGTRKKEKRDQEGEGGAASLPSQDVSFLHSFLSSEHRHKLGITGASHFYLALTAPTSSSSTSSLYVGDLVFPLTGTTLPDSIPSYDYSKAIHIGPSSGSTYPAHPFWGIAHLPGELSFYLDGKVLTDVKVDAILLDSGTSGIVGSPSEVAKIFAAAGRDRIKVSSVANSNAVLGKASCGATMKMGFEIGKGKRAGFAAVRQKVELAGKLNNDYNYGSGSGSGGRDGVSQGLLEWKSYVAAGVSGYLKGVGRVIDGVTEAVHRLILPDWKGGEEGAPSNPQEGGVGLTKRKRDMHQRLHRPTHQKPAHKKRAALQVDLGLPSSEVKEAPGSIGAEGEAGGKDDGAQDTDDMCDVTIMGSPEVDAMFASNGPEFKPWIVGTDFFYQNLVYHNIDTAVTAIVPRYET